MVCSKTPRATSLEGAESALPMAGGATGGDSVVGQLWPGAARARAVPLYVLCSADSQMLRCAVAPRMSAAALQCRAFSTAPVRAWSRTVGWRACPPPRAFTALRQT